MELEFLAICALLCVATSSRIPRENGERQNPAEDSNNNNYRADDSNSNNHRVDDSNNNHHRADGDGSIIRANQEPSVVDLSQGEPGATSIQRNHNKNGAANAFGRAIFDSNSKKSFPWVSAELPATVYIHLPNPVRVSAFSFRSRPEPEPWSKTFSPKKFALVGSKDCQEWTTIFQVESTTWTTFDQEKKWDVPEGQRRSFPCVGFKVLENGRMTVDHKAAIQDAKFWGVGGMDIRLSLRNSGRFQVRHENDWRGIANIEEPHNTAVGEVICRDLGYGQLESTARIPALLVPVISKVRCTGQEDYLQDCDITWGAPEPQRNQAYEYDNLKVTCSSTCSSTCTDPSQA